MLLKGKFAMNVNLRKLIWIFAISYFETSTQAKTTALLCETLAVAKGPYTTGPGSEFTKRDASYSTWSVVIETDESGKVIKVTLDDDVKEFSVKGDFIKFKSKLLMSLEINIKTGRARTTITGFDTREQGGCKVISKANESLLD